MSDQDLSVDVETRRAVEAIVLAATEPVHPTVMAQLLELSVEHLRNVRGALVISGGGTGDGGGTVGDASGGCIDPCVNPTNVCAQTGDGGTDQPPEN